MRVAPYLSEPDESARTAAPTQVRFPPAGGALRIGDGGVFTFSRDPLNGSMCYRECLAVWAPVLAQGGKPQAATGARKDAVGSIRRADGSFQVTYLGHPLYRPRAGSSGKHLLRSFGGAWTAARTTATK